MIEPNGALFNTSRLVCYWLPKDSTLWNFGNFSAPSGRSRCQGAILTAWMKSDEARTLEVPTHPALLK